jgi:3-hydroxyisobutyrate dehydrogenase-like beta-hydroxyacid dehydrogenase
MTTLSIHTPIGFIGAGAVGGTLAVALAQAGYRVTAIASRTLALAQGLAARVVGCTAYATVQQVVSACDLVFISTPDDA